MSTTPTGTKQRWFKFHTDGRKDGIRLEVLDDGLVQLPIESLTVLLQEAGYEQHEPDPVERAWLARREAVRSKLQEALNRRGR